VFEQATQGSDVTPESFSSAFLLLLLVAVGVFGYWLYKRLRSAPQSSDPVEKPREADVRAGKPGPRKSAVERGIDIFVSYASQDRPAAEQVATALAAAGWSVWWDRTIPPGRVFDEVIEEALTAARCVVVLWTRTSVSSDWVKSEAAEGARRRILIPVLLEEVTIPLEFRRIQAASLAGWNSSRSHAGFESLVASIRAVLDRPDHRR
jgi:hypothetical protein